MNKFGGGPPAIVIIPGNICTIIGNGGAGHKPGSNIFGREQYMFWPQNVAIDPQGRPVATDWNNYVYKRLEMDSEMCRSRRGKPDGDCPLTNVIGTTALGDSCSHQGTGPVIMASQSGMNHPVGIEYMDGTVHPSWAGNVILWGWHQWKIKYIPVNAAGSYGEMFCVWGNGRGFAGDGQRAGTGMMTMAGGPPPNLFNLPSSAVYDRQGNFYISDQANLRIRIIARDADDTDEPGESWAVSRRNNIVRTWAGGEPIDSAGFHHRTDDMYSNSGDGLAVSSTTTTFRVQFGFDALPQMRMVFDRNPARNFMYIADAENGRIRRIDFKVTPPIITTVAGCAGTRAPEVADCSVTANNVPATFARLFRPGDVDLVPDDSGDIVITDVFNNCIRLVRFSTGMIHTVAGQCGEDTAGYEGDGGAALAAKLAEPGGVGVDSHRNIFIADTLNHRIRRVNAVVLP